jgi:hypothetical protein
MAEVGAIYDVTPRGPQRHRLASKRGADPTQPPPAPKAAGK